MFHQKTPLGSCRSSTDSFSIAVVVVVPVLLPIVDATSLAQSKFVAIVAIEMCARN